MLGVTPGSAELAPATLLPHSPQRSRLHPIQRADHHIGERVLGATTAAQRRPGGLQAGLRALHARGW